MRLVFIVWGALCCAYGLSFAQTDPAGTVTSPANTGGMFQPVSRGTGPAGIPLGSTGLQMRGESPVMFALRSTLTAGSGPAGQCGIPLGSTELSNPGLTQVPAMASTANCAKLAGTGIAASAAAGTLPPRLFEGPARRLSNSNSSGSNGCATTGFNIFQRGVITQGKSGIGLGTTELTDNGLAGFIAAPTAQGQ